MQIYVLFNFGVRWIIIRACVMYIPDRSGDRVIIVYEL